MKPAPPFRPLRPAALALALLAGLAPVIDAQSPPAAQWSGSIVANANVTTDSFSRNDTQTWTLTGAPPTMSGSIAVYPAKWSYTGSGTYQSSGPGQTTTWTWTINVPPIDAQIGIVVRSSDNKLTFHQWSTPITTQGHYVSAQKSVKVGSGTPTVSNFTFGATEWNFGWIVDDPAKTDVSGSSTVNVGQLPGLLSTLAPAQNATCTWHFTYGNSGGQQPGATPLNLTAIPLTPGVVSLTIPGLTTISPAVVGQAAGTYSVDLTGSATHFVDGTSQADFGDGITVTSLTVKSPTSATARVQLTASTALGPRTVTVTTGSEVVRKTSGFSVNQGATVAPPPPVATSGYYRIILDGFRCIHQTFHDITSPNGSGDEVYASAHVYQCTQNASGGPPLTIVQSSVVTTAVHGIVTTNPNQIDGISILGAPAGGSNHVRAGSGSAQGGITNGDTFPQDPTTTAMEPVAKSFPLLLWQGQLSDSKDAVVLVPSLWKFTTGDTCSFDKWAANGGDGFSLYNQYVAQVQNDLRDRMAKADLSPIVPTSFSSIPWWYVQPLPPVASDCDCNPRKDHPIGITASGSAIAINVLTAPALGPTFGVSWFSPVNADGSFSAPMVVVTRAAIEAALASHDPTMPPGIIALHFVDTGPWLDGNYDLFLRVEHAPEVAATAPPNVATTPAAPPLAITGVTPNSGRQWDDKLVVTFESPGAHFVQGQTALDLGPGITVLKQNINLSGNPWLPGAPTDVDVASPTKILATLQIAGDAAPGPRKITITTGGEIASRANGFTVVARDVHDVFQINPNSARVAQPGVAVTISRPSPWARDYFSTQGTTLDFGPGIQVTSFTPVIGDDYLAHAKVTLNIAADAPVGPHTVTVIRPSLANDLFPGAFSVASLIDKANLATPSVGAAGAITGVSPASGKAGTGRLVLTFTGQSTHFVQDTTKIDLGPGITLADQYLFIVSPTQAIGGFKIDSGAAPGPRTVTITTGAEVARLANGFTVTP